MEGYDGSTSRYMQSKQYIILKFNLLCGLPKADCIQRCKELDFLQKYWSYQHNNLLLRYSSTYSSSRLLWFLFNDLVQLLCLVHIFDFLSKPWQNVTYFEDGKINIVYELSFIIFTHRHRQLHIDHLDSIVAWIWSPEQPD